MLETKGIDSLNNMTSPSNKTMSIIQQRAKQHEGLFQDEEGKNIDYKDRIRD